MKYLFPLLMFAPLAMAETYITYDDGGVYTLSEDESVYVSERPLFDLRSPLSGDLNFERQEPFTERDYEEPVTFGSDYAVGSHEWCVDFEPWANGLTFDQVAWNYQCDTNNNNVYVCGDVQFDASEDAEVCAGG